MRDEHDRDVLGGLALAELDVLGPEVDRVPAQLRHAGLERHPGAQRGLLEDHRQRAARERGRWSCRRFCARLSSRASASRSSVSRGGHVLSPTGSDGARRGGAVGFASHVRSCGSVAMVAVGSRRRRVQLRTRAMRSYAQSSSAWLDDERRRDAQHALDRVLAQHALVHQLLRERLRRSRLGLERDADQQAAAADLLHVRRVEPAQPLHERARPARARARPGGRASARASPCAPPRTPAGCRRTCCRGRRAGTRPAPRARPAPPTPASRRRPAPCRG